MISFTIFYSILAHTCLVYFHILALSELFRNLKNKIMLNTTKYFPFNFEYGPITCIFFLLLALTEKRKHFLQLRFALAGLNLRQCFDNIQQVNLQLLSTFLDKHKIHIAKMFFGWKFD